MFTWEMIEPAVTLMTSVSSIVIAAVVGNSVIKSQEDQRKHNKLSVKPHLHAEIKRVESEGVVRFCISNHGVGPAMISLLQYRLENGEVYDSLGLIELCLRLVPRLRGKCKCHTVTFNYPYALMAGDEVEILKITVDHHDDYDLASCVAKRVKETTNCDIHYKSLYGEVFEVTNP